MYSFYDQTMQNVSNRLRSFSQISAAATVGDDAAAVNSTAIDTAAVNIADDTTTAVITTAVDDAAVNSTAIDTAAVTAGNTADTTADDNAADDNALLDNAIVNTAAVNTVPVDVDKAADDNAADGTAAKIKRVRKAEAAAKTCSRAVVEKASQIVEYNLQISRLAKDEQKDIKNADEKLVQRKKRITTAVSAAVEAAITAENESATASLALQEATSATAFIVELRGSNKYGEEMSDIATKAAAAVKVATESATAAEKAAHAARQASDIATGRVKTVEDVTVNSVKTAIINSKAIVADLAESAEKVATLAAEAAKAAAIVKEAAGYADDDCKAFFALYASTRYQKMAADAVNSAEDHAKTVKEHHDVIDELHFKVTNILGKAKRVASTAFTAVTNAFLDYDFKIEAIVTNVKAANNAAKKALEAAIATKTQTSVIATFKTRAADISASAHAASKADRATISTEVEEEEEKVPTLEAGIRLLAGMSQLPNEVICWINYDELYDSIILHI